MAESPEAGSIARREDAGGPPERRSVLGRLGLGKEPSERAPYLRAILAGLKEAGAKQLEQFPLLGPLGEVLLRLPYPVFLVLLCQIGLRSAREA